MKKQKGKLFYEIICMKHLILKNKKEQNRIIFSFALILFLTQKR
ncbi:hypothetical protein PJIAN_4622 [Paludibacter jiangxiensis]|mgnify:CR=1 FL=1|uniref:Uncharacterized protein n=1 Tax=Paludibacter jiangxiensis TaxID=681398 RepID=A0A161LGK7_9BACT|nr:hypothetical protein PJIAN_4622 [Paludibacter jiangxiensis]